MKKNIDKLAPPTINKMKTCIKTLISLSILLFFFIVPSNAQSFNNIKGIVVDDLSGEPLIGVSVVLKGNQSVGAITDLNGLYTIKIPVSNKEQSIAFTYLGYASQEFKVAGKVKIDVRLKENVEKLDEVVVVGYGVQKRVNMTGSVSSVKADEMKSLPVANISNALGGRVSGLVTQQASGEPGNDASTLFLRGVKPMILVDGFEVSDYNKVNMAEVESVTLLKDASAVAPYGVRGANGVVLITTKRGDSKNKLTVNYSGEFGVQSPTNSPNFMNAADCFRLQKEAYLTDGNTAQANAITDEMLASYDLGTDAYPNTDWVKNYMKSSTSQRHTVSVNGGNDVMKAYAVLGYMNQGSMFGENQDYSRYNMRSNLDFKVTKTTTLSIDASISSDEKKSNQDGSSAIMLNIYRARAFEADVYSNGLSAGQSSIGGSMNQTVHGGGDKSDKNSYENITLMLNQELPFVKGLSIKGKYNINKKDYRYNYWVTPYTYYTYDAVNDAYNPTTTATTELTQGTSLTTINTAQGLINYANKFGVHGISGLVVYERSWRNYSNFYAKNNSYSVFIPELNMGSPDKMKQANGGSSSESAQDGVVLRVNYDYAQKYLVEFASRYDRTYYYAQGRRGVFCPSLSIGWRVSEESFIKNNNSIINNLKLRASYGRSAIVAGTAFAHLSSYNVTNSYVWGLGSSSIQEQGLAEASESNPYATWETVWKSNFGFDLSLWNGLFGVEFDVFNDLRTDKMINPSATVSSEYGTSLSQENSGIEERYGFDLTLLNSTQINKKFRIDNSFIFGFNRNRQIEINEAPGTYNIPQFRRTGYPSSQLRGYVAEGLFANQDEIDNWVYQSSSTLPGDIKYKDINGDGKIDSQDQVVIGKTRVPEIMYGYNLSIHYGRFDANLSLQGTGNSSFYLGQDASGATDRGVRYPFDNNKPRVDHINSWSENNQNPSAAYPRLSMSKRDLNYVASTFWVVNSAYLKLKSLEMGYSLNPNWTKKASMQNVRFSMNFYNLLTIFSKMPKDFDVENQNYNTYPQQFISSLGVNITF